MKNNFTSTLFKSYHKSCKVLFTCIRQSKDYSYGYVLGQLNGLHTLALFCNEYKLADYIDSHNEKLFARYEKIMHS